MSPSDESRSLRLVSQFLSNTGWSFLSFFFQQGSSLIASIVTVRILGKQHFGELGIVLSTVGMFGAYAGLRLGTTATRYISEYRKKDPKFAGEVLGMTFALCIFSGICFSTLLIAFAPYYSHYWLKNLNLNFSLRLGCSIVILNALYSGTIGALAGFSAFKSIALVSLIDASLIIPMVALGAIYGGVDGVIATRALSRIAPLILSLSTLLAHTKKSGIKIRLDNYQRTIKVLTDFSLPTLLCTMIHHPTLWLANTGLVGLSNGFSQLALFRVARHWWTLILVVPSIFDRVFFPMFTEIHTTNDNRIATRFLAIIAIINAVIASCLLVLVFLFCTPILSLYGKEFAAGGTTLKILTIAAVFVAFSTPFTRLLAAASKMWINFFINLIWSIIMLSSFFFYWIDFGSVGLASSFLLAYMVQCILITAIGASVLFKAKGRNCSETNHV